ncbi:hypothetical protein [Pedobacter paludis]|uniref:Uncharacterized protein n=1 Tax=Pedobacter paludis TaxID=2203212 RepID=A0A317F466_9SPHI|nr:hypothetical protein [Pedobacter paludis]PWS32827.1 hypothetical protein DF947_07075 [Pedobacter paludis]
MKIVVLIISLTLFIYTDSMGQKTDKNLMVTVTDFDAFLEKYLKEYSKLEGLILLNPNQTVYPPGNVMPLNPYFYTLTEDIYKFKNLKHLRLQSLYILDLPDNITKCKLETLAIPLSPESNIQSILTKLKKCKYLKEIDLVSAVISDKTRLCLKKELPHIKFVDLMDDISFSEEIEN